MLSQTYLGVDPGTTGAAAVIVGGNVAVYDLPTEKVRVNGSVRTRLDLIELAALARSLEMLEPRRVLIEHVGGVQGQGGSKMFQFGFATGAVHGVFAALGFRPEVVHPIRWKNAFRLPGGKDGKSKSRERAAELWPNSAHLFIRAKDADRAEAALIAEYGRRLDA